MMPKTFEVETKDTVTQQQLNDLLVAAVEGGVNYWADYRNYRWENEEDYSVEFGIFSDESEDDGVTTPPSFQSFVTVKASDLVKVLPKLREFSIYPINKGGSISDYLENMDANTGDIAVQLLLFGDVIYG